VSSQTFYTARISYNQLGGLYEASSPNLQDYHFLNDSVYFCSPPPPPPQFYGDLPGKVGAPEKGGATEGAAIPPGGIGTAPGTGGNRG